MTLEEAINKALADAPPLTKTQVMNVAWILDQPNRRNIS